MGIPSLKRYERESNFELLRIISMLLIVAHHFWVHSPWPHESLARDIFLNVMGSGGKVGVALFIMTSGYFMVCGRFRARSLFSIVYRTAFYGVAVILVGLAIFPPGSITLESAIDSFLSGSGLPWFASCYVTVYLLSPFLNRFAATLGRGDYRRLLVLSTVLFSGFPFFQQGSLVGNTLWFMYLYLLAGYIRIYDPAILRRARVPLLLAVVPMVALRVAFVMAPEIANPLIANPVKNAGETQSVLVLAISLGLFEVFKDLRIGRSKAINLVASTTFGIYLIHDNCFVRIWLWPHFTWVYWLPFPLFVVASLLVVAGVFLACAALELVRQLVVGAIVPRLPLGGLHRLYGMIDERMRVRGRTD